MGRSQKLKVLCGFMVAAGVASALGQAPPSSPLDFAAYRERVEPIFLKARDGGARCYDCHSVLSTRLRLETLTPGSASWTQAQSLQNFQNVAKVISLSDPLNSPLLLHPLAHGAGGDLAHTGGKFWKSKDDLEWRAVAAWVKAASPGTPKSGSESASISAKDFEYFKSKIQPIFLKERQGHARCYGCHVLANRTFHLEPVPPGENNWTDVQSRKNMQSVLTQVVPGEPLSSRLLTHPLAPESGGEAFHSGGRQFESQADPDWEAIAHWVQRLGGQSTDPRTLLFVTNSAGDTIDVIDTETNNVVQVISGIELPHGIAFSTDGSRIYVSNESESVLDVVDRKSGAILKKISLSGHPNNLAITKDGAKVLVGIRDAGAVDVIDTTSMRRVSSIPVDGSVHNVFVTPDGKYAVSGSIENKSATVIELAKGTIAWTIQFDRGVRPMAFETNSDGSTSRMFVQLSGVNGFAVVDFARRVEVSRTMLPEQPGGFGILEGRNGTPSHGIGVAPDGKSLWVNSTLANATFEYSLPDLKLVGHVALPLVHPMGRPPTGSVPEWIVFTPDSKFMYVSNSGARSVSCVDTKTLKVITEIAVGEVPKRMGLLALHSSQP